MNEQNVLLEDLKVRDISLKPIFQGFNPETRNYKVRVQSDIYGVLVSPITSKDINVTVCADTDVKSYEGDLNYKAGDTIPYDEFLGGYVVQLSQAYEDYDHEFVQTVTIKLEDGSNSSTYTIEITREEDTAAYKLFKEASYTGSNGVELPYLLYLPTNYDESKKYPVVFALHGSGQRQQPLDMVLKRYQMATVWAKDSEKGHNECIVFAPQCLVEDPDIENWTTLMAYWSDPVKYPDPYTGMPQLDAAYELLLKILKEYSCDLDRIYMTGLSAGGFATFTLSKRYPDLFAALAPNASGADPNGLEAIKGIPIWLFQAAGDPLVKTDEFYYPTIEALDKAGIEYKKSFYEEGAVFFPTAHFSWVAMYANEEFRDWLFEQHK